MQKARRIIAMGKKVMKEGKGYAWYCAALQLAGWLQNLKNETGIAGS
jgi:hypothetical protein